MKRDGLAFSHLLQILVHKLNGHGALAHGGSDSLDRAGAHVPRSKHAGAAGLQQKRLPARGTM